MKKCPVCGRKYEQESECPICGVLLIDSETNTAISVKKEKHRFLAVEKGKEQAKVKPGIWMMIIGGVCLVIAVGIAARYIRKNQEQKSTISVNQSAEPATVDNEENNNNIEYQYEEDTEDDALENEKTENVQIEKASPEISMKNIVNVSATSMLSENGMSHSADRLIDGNLSTAWVEGVGGTGQGESFSLNFDGTYMVQGITIWSGYQKSEYAYYNNARPEEISVEFSDGEKESYTLEDCYGKSQEITFSEAKESSLIKVTIESVYEGSKYEDTCISEIQIY